MEVHNCAQTHKQPHTYTHTTWLIKQCQVLTLFFARNFFFSSHCFFLFIFCYLQWRCCCCCYYSHCCCCCCYCWKHFVLNCEWTEVTKIERVKERGRAKERASERAWWNRKENDLKFLPLFKQFLCYRLWMESTQSVIIFDNANKGNNNGNHTANAMPFKLGLHKFTENSVIPRLLCSPMCMNSCRQPDFLYDTWEFSISLNLINPQALLHAY